MTQGFLNYLALFTICLLYTIAMSSWFVGNADGKRSMFKELTKSNNSVYKKQLVNTTTDETGKLLPNYIHK